MTTAPPVYPNPAYENPRKIGLIKNIAYESTNKFKIQTSAIKV